MIAVVFGAGYWYYVAEAVCDVPIAYRIGSIDEEFDISKEEVRSAASAAESLWEDATGRNLFTHDESARVSINLIFDDRQAEALLEADLRDELEDQQDKSKSIEEQYKYLLETYEDLKEDYEARQVQYEADLQAHNVEVERWNSAGGAPEDIFENLENRQQELAEEQEELNSIAYRLNQLVKRINAIGDEGNSLIEGYNEIVEEYNTRFNEEKEFTQGEYQAPSTFINSIRSMS